MFLSRISFQLLLSTLALVIMMSVCNGRPIDRRIDNETSDSLLTDSLGTDPAHHHNHRPLATTPVTKARRHVSDTIATWAHLYSSRHNRFLAVYRRNKHRYRRVGGELLGRRRKRKRRKRKRKLSMEAFAVRQGNHSLLKILTDKVNKFGVYINIYSWAAGRYICFSRRGRLRLLKHPKRHREALCSFRERLADARRGTLQYVVDEHPVSSTSGSSGKPRRHRDRHRSGGRHKWRIRRPARVISFCGSRRQPNLQVFGRQPRVCSEVVKHVVDRYHGHRRRRRRPSSKRRQKDKNSNSSK